MIIPFKPGRTFSWQSLILLTETLFSLSTWKPLLKASQHLINDYIENGFTVRTQKAIKVPLSA